MTRARIIGAVRVSACPRKTARITVVNAKLDGEANTVTPVSKLHILERIDLGIFCFLYVKRPISFP